LQKRRKKMKKVISIAAVIVSILLALVFIGGCLGQRIAEEAIERAIEKDSGGDVEIDLDEGEVTIQSDEGEVSISSDEETVEIKSDEGEATFGEGAELPEGFPDAIPVYGNMDITSSWSSTDEGVTSYSISAISEDSVDDIFEWYKSQLQGWEISGEFTMDSDDGKTSSLNAVGEGFELNIMVAEDEDGALVILGVTEQ
jgi:hypothetical protein